MDRLKLWSGPVEKAVMSEKLLPTSVDGIERESASGSRTLVWIQCGACGGDTMSLLNCDERGGLNLLLELGFDVLWHPSLSKRAPRELDQLFQRLCRGEQPLNVLVVEGFVIRGPHGQGGYDTLGTRPKRLLVEKLAAVAGVTVAVGTCAAFGGIGTIGEVEASGLQFHRDVRGGFLGAGYRSATGRPVLNIPGCPVHPAVLKDVLVGLAAGDDFELNRYQAPVDWYELLVHQGCVRNEYHEYRVEEHDFGEPGCLFFHLGCRGPLTAGPCNKALWLGRQSKTGAGTPCFGCSDPRFPKSQPFFATANIAEVPVELPAGVDRAHYLAYKGMAAAAAPERLKKRNNRV